MRSGTPVQQMIAGHTDAIPERCRRCRVGGGGRGEQDRGQDRHGRAAQREQDSIDHGPRNVTLLGAIHHRGPPVKRPCDRGALVVHRDGEQNVATMAIRLPESSRPPSSSQGGSVMTQALSTVVSNTGTHQRQPALSWCQPGHPLVRVEATADPIYPYALRIGDHATTRLPMTAVAIRALRDALTALLETTTPIEADDFLTAWAQAHGAEVVTNPPSTDATASDPGVPARAHLYRMAA
jgi:hypothetical protein